MATTAVTGLAGSDSMRFDYLNLLVTQLRNQNPLEPLDNNAMASQLSQFAQLEQLENLNSGFGKVLAATQVSQGAALIGKTVSYAPAEGEGARSGVVQRVVFTGGEARLIVGTDAVGFEDILSVGN
jgi:flagellar basal-body rod modification protein FlgD